MLILASNSPRRKQLLETIGWECRVISPAVNELIQAGERPDEYAIRLAKTKAMTVLENTDKDWEKEDLILAADTIVLEPGEGAEADNYSRKILGKPSGPSEAEEMLQRLRGRTHQVCTAVAIANPLENSIHHMLEVTEVQMRDFTLEEMRKYIHSGDPFDKAGGYAIQNSSFRPVKRVKGCYPNVMGLPVCQVRRMVAELQDQADSASFDECRKDTEPCWIYLQAIDSERYA